MRRYRPVPSTPWLVFAAGVVLFIGGDILVDVSPNASSPSASDELYLVGYPLLAATVVMLVISSGSHRRTGALIDAAIVTLAFAVFQWIYVMVPAINAPGPAGQRVVLGILFPVMDIVLLGAAAGFFVSPAWRTPAFALLVIGMGTQLIGDEAVSLSPSYTVPRGPTGRSWRRTSRGARPPCIRRCGSSASRDAPE